MALSSTFEQGVPEQFHQILGDTQEYVCYSKLLGRMLFIKKYGDLTTVP